MNISGLGSSELFSQAVFAGMTSGGPGRSANGSATNAGVSLSNDTINTVMDDTTNYTLGTSVDYLMYQLNSAVLGPTTSAAGAQGAIDTYTQSLAFSNVYDSPYTAPSAQFLSDLSALKNDANAGDWAAARTDLAQAKQDEPLSVADGMAAAKGNGDTAGEAALVVEATANMSDALVANGYTPTAARDEADAIAMNGFFGSSSGDSASIKAWLDAMVDLTKDSGNGNSATGQGGVSAPTASTVNVL